MRRTKGHNTGQKGHYTGQKGLLRDKRDKTSSFRTKGQKGHLFGPVFFPGRGWSPAWSTRALLSLRQVMLNLKQVMKLNLFTNYLLINYFLNIKSLGKYTIHQNKKLFTLCAQFQVHGSQR